MRFWHALHALRLGSSNAPVTCEDAAVLVNDDGIDEVEFAQTAAQTGTHSGSAYLHRKALRHLQGLLRPIPSWGIP